MPDDPDDTHLDVLYAWQVFQDGRWGLIAGILPRLGLTVLVHRDREIIEHMRPVAEAHGQQTGLPIRLAAFELAPDPAWNDLGPDDCPGCAHGRVRYCPVHGLRGTAPR